MTLYELCFRCDHFIDANDVPMNDPGWQPAWFIHLDNGEKEHDHDAQPSGLNATLGVWQWLRPDLFTADTEGNIGPNRPGHRHMEGRIAA